MSKKPLYDDTLDDETMELPNDDSNRGKRAGEVEKTDKSAGTSFVFPEDYEIDESKNILVEDGYFLQHEKKTVRVGSKVNTEFNQIEAAPLSDEEAHDNFQIGKKDKLAFNTSVKDLKKQYGFSWQNFSRKLAIAGIAFLIVLVVLTSGFAALAIDRWNNTRSVDDLLGRPAESSVVYARDGKTKIYEFFQEGSKREIVGLCNNDTQSDPAINCIPEEMQLAMIALEDENFFQNESGIPWRNIVGAASKCVLSVGDECRGASGISQQLVKNVTGDKDVTLDRKINELFTAIKLNQDKPNKLDILELYLNWVPFGRNAYGVQAAAKSYYGKNVKDINVVESCYLASLVQQPSYFSSGLSNQESDAWKDLDYRKNACLEKLRVKNLKGDGKPPLIQSDDELLRLQETVTILAKNDDEAQTARNEGKIAFVPNKVTDEFPHFREFVTQELTKFVSEQDLYTKGYKIVTTLDPDKQREVQKILRDSEKDNILANNGNNAAAIVLDGPTGEIISMVGSLGYDRTDIDGQVNIMTSPQQPGSSMKPYVYAAAMAKGFNPGTVVVDTPTEFQPGFKPKNFDGTTQGPVTLRSAHQNSLNIPTIKVACMAAGEGKNVDCNKGIGEVFGFAEKVGVVFPCYAPTDGQKVCSDPSKARTAYRNRCFLGSALGGCELTGVSHATGINTLLQDGNLRTATPFISIKDRSGKEIYTRESRQNVYPSEDKVIDPLIARQMQNVMSDYEARRPKFGSSSRNLELSECKVAAKTGTTNDVKDTWTVGGCSNYTTVVWVGRTDNQPMKQNATSSTAAAPVWNRIMKYLVKDQKPKQFTTDGLIRVSLDPATGQLVNSGGIGEWVTPAQKKILEEAGGRISSADYNPSENTIFENRSAVISQEQLINKLDGKLATSQTLPENIEKKSCLQLVPEFPNAKNWADPVNAIASRSDRYCRPITEKSDQDQVGQQNQPPSIQTNVTSSTSIKTISVTASPNGTPGKTISKIEVFVNDNPFQSATDTSQVEINDLSSIPSSFGAGPYRITIRVFDNFGVSSQVSFDNVTLDSGSNTVEITQSDLANLSVVCSAVVVNSTTTCSFSIGNNKLLPADGLRLSIQDAVGTSSNCTLVWSNEVRCSNVPTPSKGSGNKRVFAQIGSGSRVDTGSRVTI